MSIVTLETRAALKMGFHTLDQHDHATWRSLIDRGLITDSHTIAHGDKTEQLYLASSPTALPDIRKGIRIKAS